MAIFSDLAAGMQTGRPGNGGFDGMAQDAAGTLIERRPDAAGAAQATIATIATPEGEIPIDRLSIGDMVRGATGRDLRIRWIGRRTVHFRFGDPRSQPVRIPAGALGPGVPHSDLVLTPDHEIVLDGLAVCAADLVGRRGIAFVPERDLPRAATCYHVETAGHDAILVNGAAVDTFLDSTGRGAFDNFDEYLLLYGADRNLFEMDRPRAAGASRVSI